MFVGRSADLAQVDELLAEAAAGNAGVLWLTGDPGVGKSALVDVATRRARRRGLQTALVRAAPFGGATTAALIDDLRRAVGGPSADLGARRPDRGTGTASLVDALVDELVGWARGAPSLVTIDDLTSADEDSVAAVVGAVSRSMGLPLAVLLTGPDAVLPASTSDGASAALARWPQRRLGPLDTLAAAAVARSALGPGASERTVAALVAARHGNPGAIRDTARLLTPDEVSGAVPLPDPLPLSPAACRPWTAVLDDLPLTTRAALGALAALRPTRYDLLTAVLTSSGSQAAALETAIDRGLLRCDDQGVPEFVQPLLRAAIVAMLTPAERRALHRSAALVADRLQLSPRLVADHWMASTTTADPTVADALAALAERARRDQDVHGAAHAQTCSARLTPEPGLRRARILGAVQDRLECINDPGVVEELLHLLGPDPVPVELSAWVMGLRASVEPDLAVAAAEHALAIEQAREHTPGLLRELLWRAATSAWAMGEPRAAMSAVDEFVRLDEAGEQSGPDLPAWSAIALRAAGLFQLGAVAASATLRNQALAAADELDATRCDLDLLMRALELDDILLADTPGSRSRMAAALQRSTPGSPMTPCLWGMAAWQARARGDWGSALLLIHDGVALCHELSAVWPLDGLLAVSVELAALQGDGERLARHGRALRDLGIWSSDRRRLAILDRATGMAELAAGSLDAAAASLGQAADVAFLGRGLRDAVIPSGVDLIEVLQRLDRRDEACERAGALHTILRSMDRPLAQAWDERISALLSDGPEADLHYEAAISAHAAESDPFDGARTELLYGEHLRRTQRRSQARVHLSRAATVFARIRATPWLERARQELRVAGGAPRRPASWPAAALTGQETNIAAAVAQGRSTREVAELLVLSPRTVETHLSSVYRKLGLTGRSGLAQALAPRHD